LCLYLFYISGIHIYIFISRVRFLRKKIIYLYVKSVKWRFTLKFISRQIQEGRLLVRVICIYVCNMCVMRSRTNGFCRFSKFNVQKGTSCRRSIFSALQRTLQSNRKRSHANRLWDDRMITKIILYMYPWNVWFTNARRETNIRVKQMLITSHMHRVKQSNYFHVCSAHIEADIISYNSSLLFIYTLYIFFFSVPTRNSGNWELRKCRRTWDSLLLFFSAKFIRGCHFLNMPFKTLPSAFFLSLSLSLSLSHKILLL